MLYPVCPTCGALLSNIQLAYQKDLKELCSKHNLDLDTMSKISKSNEFIEEHKIIVDKYCDKNRYCCRMRLTNFCELVKLIE